MLKPISRNFLVFLAFCFCYAQAPDKPAAMGAPRFAAASIKRNQSLEQLSMAAPMGVGYRPGGRLVAGNAPLAMLIQRAYSVQDYQVAGGPSWIHTDGYDIEAKPESNTDQKGMWLMLQTLLADRFKLSVRRETKEMSAYQMVVLKTGKIPGCQEWMIIS